MVNQAPPATMSSDENNQSDELAVLDAQEENALVDELQDRLAAFKALTADDLVGADNILAEWGATGAAERDSLAELAVRAPLARPDRFEEAHRLAFRSIEVLGRNGSRPPQIKAFGPLQPVARFLVGLVTRFIVRSYLQDVVNGVRVMYIRREAQCAKDSQERFLLRRARIDAERVAPTFKGDPLGLPTFLVGGAALSSVVSGLGNALRSAGSGPVGRIVAGVVLVVVLLLVSWVLLRGAAVARKRIRTTVDQPLQALWETVGAAGKPPLDPSREFALIALLLTIAILVIPAVVGLLFWLV